MDVDSPGPSFSYDIQYGSNGVYLATLQGSSYGDYFVNISITEGVISFNSVITCREYQ